ncbi:MAG: MgtC/SapB family protein [Acidobacteria bacterium]|nr:MgtC/SapB family protein [Acidobacteriota bacterium]
MNPNGATSLLELMLRLFVAASLGGVLGLNRVLHGKPTGFRTLALVSLGSAMATMAVLLGNSPVDEDDPNPLSRVVQGVLTGIGFLGAGVILRDAGGHVKGLTTAATIWTAAVLGVFCGLGRLGVAGLSTLLALGILHGGVAVERLAERIFKNDQLPPTDGMG